jgi:SpoIID/LytB domain protein
MCQHGAIGMAASGAGFREILSHYYPNTTLISQP